MDMGPLGPDRSGPPKWRTCPTTHKRRFLSEDEARQGLIRARRRYERGEVRRLEQNYYLCPHCGDWHLTSHPTDASFVDELRHWLHVIKWPPSMRRNSQPFRA